MKLCRKCKTAIDDMTDGCAKCLPWKNNWLVEDSAEGNSLLDELKQFARELRAEREGLNHMRKMAARENKGSYAFDAERVKALTRLVEAHNKILSGINRLEKDNEHVLQRMSAKDRLMAYAKALCTLPVADRLAVLNLTEKLSPANPKARDESLS